MVHRIAFREEFSRLPGGLEHVADGNCIPKNQTAIFHSSLIATIQQTFLVYSAYRSFCNPIRLR